MQNSSGLVSDSTFNIAHLQNLELAMQAAGVGIWNILLTNPWMMEWDGRCQELLGCKGKNSIPYSEALLYIHLQDLKAVEAATKKAFDAAAGGSFDITYRVSLNKNDTFRWIRSIGKVSFNDAALPTRFSGISMDVTAEILTKEKSAVTENLASAAIKGTTVGVFYLNLENDQLEYSPAYSIIITGENKEKCNREYFLKHFHPDDLKFRKAAFEESQTSGEVYYEIRTIWNDGTIHWIRTVGTFTYAPTGKPLLLSGIVQDITDQRQKEDELKEAESKYSLELRRREAMFRNVTSTSPTGLWMSNEEGKLTYLNETLTQWTGMPYELLLGHGWANAVIDEDRPHAAEVFLTTVANRRHYEVEFRIRKGSGEVMWCRAAGDPYYNEDGSYAGYVGFCMDIQEQVDSVKNLKVSEERLRTLIAQAPVAIGLLNGREMIVQTANQTILKLWGKSEAIIGLKLIDALPEIKGQPFIQLLENVYNTGETFYGYSIIAMLEHNGKMENYFFDFTYTAIKDADGGTNGVMVVATEVTAQVTARRKVEESEARFKTLIKEAMVPTALFSGRDMNIEVVNEAMLQVWGRDERVLGLTLIEALPELKDQPFLHLLNKVFTSGISYHENNARADLLIDGMLKTSYFNFNYKPLKNEYGETYAILNMAMNVTDQVIATQKIKESELFARSILFNSPVANVVFTGEDMIISTVNEIMLSMLGRDESIIGKPFMEAVPELIPTPLMERLRKVLHTGETYYQPEEKLELIKNGNPYTGYYNYTYKSLTNTSGELYGVIVTATEVTDQVAARRKIEEAEEALRGAIELAELGTWEVDLVNGTRYFSDRYRRWAGFGKDEVIDRNKSLSVIAEKYHDGISASIAKALDPLYRSIYESEYVIMNRITGEERIIHSTGKAYFNNNGEAYKLNGTAQDITKQRTLQLALEQEVRMRTQELQLVNEELKYANEELFESNERLVRSNEELAQYAYVASHDLQEPLRKIRMFSDMLCKQFVLPVESKEVVEKIINSSRRMTQLIQDLLEFSRLLNTDLVAKPVDLSQICRAVCEDFEMAIKEKQAEVKTGILPVIEAVELQMNQLFHNLFSNGLKFSITGKKPVIEISSEVLGKEETKKYIVRPNEQCKYYHIRFKDNGIGFDMKYSDQIFEVFKRLHGREKYSGSGIGLALCRRIVINHQGHMFVESAPGKGTVFHIILPAKSH